MGHSAETLSDLQVCRALKGCIAEFLAYHGLQTTLKASHLFLMSSLFASPSFEEEFYTKRIANASTLAIPFEAKTAFLQFFKAGDGPSFFTLWAEHAPPDSSKAMLSLRLELHSYFLVWGPTNGGVKEGFESFLGESGGQLALEKDQLHYFALPHVTEPQSHPLFQELFTVEWREALRQKLEAFLDYRDPTKMTPLLHDMYRDFHTRLAEEFGDPAIASSFELAEADAMGAFPLGASPGEEAGVKGLSGGANVGTGESGGLGSQGDVRTSTRRSMIDWLRKLERGGQEGQLAGANQPPRKGSAAEPTVKPLVSGKNLLEDGNGFTGQRIVAKMVAEDRGGFFSSGQQLQQGLMLPVSGRPLSARTRRHLLTSSADVARQSTDSILSRQDERADRDGSPANNTVKRPLSASMSVESAAALFGRAALSGSSEQRTGQNASIERGQGLSGWQGKPGSVSQSLAFTPREGEGSESRPMTGNVKRPPKMPLIQVGLDLMKVAEQGGAKLRGDEETIDRSPSPKVRTPSLSTVLYPVAPSRTKKLSRTNSLGRPDAATRTSELSAQRAHRGSRSMDLSDARLNLSDARLDRSDAQLDLSDARLGFGATEGLQPGPSAETLRLDGRSGQLFGGVGEDVRDSFQALCNAHEVVRRSTHLTLDSIEDDVNEGADVSVANVAMDYDKIRHTLYGGSDQDVAALLQDIAKRLLSSPKTFQETLGGDPFCFLTGRKQQRPLLALLVERGGGVTRPLARALNVLASEESGRGYLLTNEAVIVETLVRITRLGCADPEAAEALHDGLEALQKLSEGRSVQKLMIRHGIVVDLTSLISGRARGALDEYGLEHALALLMTLSLRAAGKRACEAAAAELLEALMELLESDSPQVRTFVNGTLYSLLSRPEIRAAAREMDLPALLRAVVKGADATCARQIGHVLTQMHGAADAAETSDSGDSSGGEVLEPARVNDPRSTKSASARHSPSVSRVELGGESGRGAQSQETEHHLKPLSPNVCGASERNDAALASGTKATGASAKASGATNGQGAHRESVENLPAQRGGKRRGDSEVRRSTVTEQGKRPANVRASAEAFAARPKVPRTPELHSR
ncbi:hypothetical protein KFL_002140170 [Klebsormidium nitens]|uniref:LisH domain-containing protein n=1 Tax=Klebsormidium nitens TaxID=105231 RepID=A0A1Y1I3A6_KLENI|nr:hypothetical protein KFL_002140170 [Klebsormidium nitens]|eukprot:GAQ84963.1 hypothetical protein KFL_002140170 [Klebsormidium nitens]